nr:hypothetical protein [Tanacetum cinerariifolium]
ELRPSSSQLKIPVYPEVRCPKTTINGCHCGQLSVPTVAPQGLAILLADAATQTKTSEDRASPRYGSFQLNRCSQSFQGAASEVREGEVAALEPCVSKKRGRRGNDGADANAPPKVLRKDYASVRSEQSTRGGKSHPMMGLAAGATFITPADTKGVNDPDSLSYAEPQPHPEPYEISTGNMATMEVQDTRSVESAGSGKSTSSPSMVIKESQSSDCKTGSKDSSNWEEEIKKLDQEIQADAASIDSSGSSYRRRKLKAAFEEFKKYEDDQVEKRCAEMDTRLDAPSIDFDEELYPYMLTAIAGRRWVIGQGIAKGMSEGLKYGVEHGKANLDLEAIEAYDPEAETKYVAALHALRDLKYAALKPLLTDAIVANVSHAEKKKKCRVVCRTYGFSSVHHARSDGVPVSVPTVAPQGLAILLADAATQTKTSEDRASPRLLRSNSLPVMYNLD